MPDFRELKEFLKDTLGYIITFCVLAIIFVFIIAVAPIAGNSMNPTLNDGDIVIVTKYNYIFTSPKRNEIIIFKDSVKKKYVKRIIGLPGERIDYINGYLYINNEKYEESLITTNTSNFMFEDICSLTKCPNSVIPEGFFLVLGDNRPESQDSRDANIGLISKKEVIGKIVFRVLPFDEIGRIK